MANVTSEDKKVLEEAARKFKAISTAASVFYELLASVTPTIKQIGLAEIARLKKESKKGKLTEAIKDYKYSADKINHVPPTWVISLKKFDDCITGDTEIHTETGLKEISKIKIGENVLSYDFNRKEYCYKPVLNVFNPGRKKIKKIIFRNGTHLFATDNHPLWVKKTIDNWDRNNKKRVPSKYIKQCVSDISLKKRQVPCVRKLPYKVIDNPWYNDDICFVLGHFIAEGWNVHGKVCTSGQECNQITPRLNKLGIPYSLHKNNSGVPFITFLMSDFKNLLRMILGNSFNINVPREIFNLPEGKINSFLDGYLTGDGYTEKREDRNVLYGCSTSCDKFADDLTLLHLQLGKPIYRNLSKNTTSAGGKPIWRFEYNPNSHFNTDYGYPGISEMGIKSIEDWGEEEVFDIQVADTKSFITKTGLISHNCDGSAWLINEVAEKCSIFCIARVVKGEIKDFEKWHFVVQDINNIIWSNFQNEGEWIKVRFAKKYWSKATHLIHITPTIDVQEITVL